MSADKDSELIPAINRLVAEIEAAEAKTAGMKRTVNELCGFANLPVKYPKIEDSSPTGGRGVRIQPGQFYRKPLATAVSSYLRMRGDPNAGGSGPAELDEIYAVLEEGGFKFDAKNEMTAKRSLAIALAKNSQTFEKLPTGQFGLKVWYRREAE